MKSADQSKVLKDIKNWLRMQQNLGIKYIKNSDVIKEFINRQDMTVEEEILETSSLEKLKEEIKNCTLCPLHKKRTNPVFGEGAKDALLMLVGEAPGREEDLTGRPFVGVSGQLLTKMLRAINIERNSVFITSVVKCRPPNNRTPNAKEIKSCKPFLYKQIELIKPKILLALGQCAAHAILDTKVPLKELRAKPHNMKINNCNLIVFVTYHPAFLLRQYGEKQIFYKRQAWHDLKMLKKAYDKIKDQP